MIYTSSIILTFSFSLFGCVTGNTSGFDWFILL